MSRFLIALSILLIPLSARAADFARVKSKLAIYADDREGPLSHPEGVGCGDKSLVVADTADGRLLRYSLEDGVVKGGAEIKVAQLPYPIRVQLDSKGEIFVLDGKTHRIVRLSPEGVFESFVELRGVPAPERVVPRSLKLDAADNLYVLDIFGERVIEANRSGQFVKQIATGREDGFFSDLAVNSRGDILLVDSVNVVVFSNAKDPNVFSPLTKSLQQYVNFPVSLAVDGRDNIYLSDETGGRIVVLGPDGSFRGQVAALGWKPGLLYYPSQVCLMKGTDDIEIAVADRNNSRVQVFFMSR